MARHVHFFAPQNFLVASLRRVLERLLKVRRAQPGETPIGEALTLGEVTICRVPTPRPTPRPTPCPTPWRTPDAWQPLGATPPRDFRPRRGLRMPQVPALLGSEEAVALVESYLRPLYAGPVEEMLFRAYLLKGTEDWGEAALEALRSPEALTFTLGALSDIHGGCGGSWPGCSRSPRRRRLQPDSHARRGRPPRRRLTDPLR